MKLTKELSTQNNNTIIHEWISNNVQPDWIAIDMTAGKGRDTYQLAQYANHVFSIDIQEEALSQTKSLTKNLNNITYILDDHVNIHQYVNEFVHLVIFNLGYLPDGDKSIKTEAKSTLMALGKVYPKIRKDGFLIITCYRGHPGGKREHEMVDRWLKHHKNFEIQTLKYNKSDAPITYICKKTSFDAR